MSVVKLDAHKERISDIKTSGIGYITRKDKAYAYDFINCTEKGYVKEFNDRFDMRKHKRKDNNTYYHYKISYNPKDNVSFELAHKLGLQQAEFFSDLGYLTVVSTHKDTGKAHNHIIFSSVNNSGNMYLNTKQNLRKFKKFHDEIMRKHNLTTNLQLSQNAKEKIKENIAERNLNGKLSDKKILKNTIDVYINRPDIKNIYDFVKKINSETDINCYFRGTQINFSMNNKKYRNRILGEEYSFNAIKRKISGDYSDTQKIKDFIDDVLKTCTGAGELEKMAKEHEISVKQNKEDIIFFMPSKKEKSPGIFEEKNEDNNDSTVSLYKYKRLTPENFINQLEKNKLIDILKLDFYKLTQKEYKTKNKAKDKTKNTVKNENKTDNTKNFTFDDFIEKLKNLEYVKDVKVDKNSIVIFSDKTAVDTREMGYGTDSDNRFAISNIKRNLEINNIGFEIKNLFHKGKIKTYADVTDYLNSKNISVTENNGTLYAILENKKINIKRFISIEKETEKRKWSSFFISLKKITSFEDFLKIDGVEQKDKDYFFIDKKLSEVKYNNVFLNYDGIVSILESNIMDKILNSALTYEDYLCKLKENKIKNNKDEYEVKQHIANNNVRKSFYKVAFKACNISEMETSLRKMGFVITLTGNKYLITEKNTSGQYSISEKALDRIMLDNKIKTDIFCALKTTDTFSSFKDKIEKSGHMIDDTAENIKIDGKDITKYNIKNKLEENIFTTEMINERLKENYDYKNKTETSKKYMFLNIYKRAVKESMTMVEFRANLEKDDRMETKIIGDDIFFRTQDTDKWTNSDTYNSKNCKFFSVSKVEKILEEKKLHEKIQAIYNMIYSFFSFFDTRDARLYENRNSTAFGISKQHSMTAKRLFEEKINRLK